MAKKRLSSGAWKVVDAGRCVTSSWWCPPAPPQGGRCQPTSAAGSKIRFFSGHQVQTPAGPPPSNWLRVGRLMLQHQMDTLLRIQLLLWTVAELRKPEIRKICGLAGRHNYVCFIEADINSLLCGSCPLKPQFFTCAVISSQNFPKFPPSPAETTTGHFSPVNL